VTDDPLSSIPFEQALADLEQVVDQMESGDLSLEASLSAFERGIGLTRQCQQRLREAEQQVQMLTQQTSDAQPEDFSHVS
jgi:exodeoxyribonuclease VII small subunit